jgi:hypothetical protein
MQRHHAVLLGMRVEQRKNAGTYAQEDVRSAGWSMEKPGAYVQKAIARGQIRADGEGLDGRNHFF